MSAGSAHEPVGVIGLGSLGLPVARNLAAAGYAVLGYRRRPRSDAEGGIAIAPSPAEVGRRCTIIVTCLPSSEALAAVVSGPRGLCDSVGPGSVVVDLGTLPVAVKETQRRALRAVGASMLDCGVSGSYRYIEARSAALFVGGDDAAFRRCAAVLRAITDHVCHVGGFGTGTAMKLIASLLVPVHTLAAAEAFSLAARAGIPARTVYQAIAGTQASSAMFETRGARMLDGDYAGPAMRDYYERNIAPAMAMARQDDGGHPLLEAVERTVRGAIDGGFGDLDLAAVYDFLGRPGDVPDGNSAP